MKIDFNEISFEKAKDIILAALISNNKLLNSTQFKEELFTNASLEDINFLLKSILESELNLLKGYVGRQVYITSIGNIKPFLKNGGFEKMHSKNIQNERKDFYDYKISRGKYYTFWFLIIFSSIVSFINCYKFYVDYTSKDSSTYEERIHKLEEKIQKLDSLNKSSKPAIQSISTSH